MNLHIILFFINDIDTIVLGVKIMKLSVALILYEFRKRKIPPSIICDGLLDEHTSISKVRLFCDEAYSDDVLYIASYEDIKLKEKLPKLLFVTGAQDTELIHGVVYFDLTVTELFNAIDDIFEHYSKIESDLRRAIARNAPLRTILSICTLFFDNPVTLSDTHLRLIETSDNVVRENMPEYFRIAMDTGFIDNRLINILKNKNLNSKLYNNQDVMLVKLDEVPTAWFSSNIYDSGKLVAVIAVHEVFTPIDEAQTVIVEQIKSMIDDYTFKSSRRHSASFSTIENIILELISGHNISDDLLDSYLKDINWNSNDGFYLALVQASKDSLENGTAKYSYGTLQKFFPGSFILELDKNAIIVINAARLKYDLKKAYVEVEKHLEKMLDRVIVSRYFQSFRFLHEHYKATSEALKIAQNIDNNKYLYFFNDYIFPLMLKLCGSEYDVRIFCIKEAIDLHEYDKIHGRDFFRSLFIYLRYNKSLSVASEVLNVHPNTLIYRIGRVTDIIDVNLDDINTCQALIRSYEILHYRKIIVDLETNN